MGLLWVKVGTAERLVTASGVWCDGMQWYMESMQFAAPLPASWFAKPVVEWVVRGMYEEDEKYIMRAYNLQAGMGIVHSMVVWHATTGVREGHGPQEDPVTRVRGQGDPSLLGLRRGAKPPRTRRPQASRPHPEGPLAR